MAALCVFPTFACKLFNFVRERHLGHDLLLIAPILGHKEVARSSWSSLSVAVISSLTVRTILSFEGFVMSRDIKELGSRLEEYADTIAGFSFAQAVAFGFALGSKDFSESIVRAGWLILVVLLCASCFYAGLIHFCHREQVCLHEQPDPERGEHEQKLRRENLARTTTLRIRRWRFIVVGLAAVLSFGAVVATWYGKTHPNERVPILLWDDKLSNTLCCPTH
jgi:hypothetical protein